MLSPSCVHVCGIIPKCVTYIIIMSSSWQRQKLQAKFFRKILYNLTNESIKMEFAGISITQKIHLPGSSIIIALNDVVSYINRAIMRASEIELRFVSIVIRDIPSTNVYTFLRNGVLKNNKQTNKQATIKWDNSKRCKTLFFSLLSK